MKKKFLHSLLVGLALFMVSCKKEEVPFFNGAPGIAFYFPSNGVDTLSYSFAFSGLETGTEKEIDTIWLDMRVLGAVADYPRKIRIEPSEETTAVLGRDFALPEISLPPNELAVSYPVEIFNTEILKSERLVISLRVLPSEDLEVGATGLARDNTRATDRFKIWISNQLEKPSWWLDPYWGLYSGTKYRFMMNTMGIVNFSAAEIGLAGILNYPVTLRNALAVYELEHGPLIDESGNRVTF